MSSKKDHRQRRRRKLNAVIVFKLITALGQAAYLVARLWIWISDKQ